MKKSLIAAGLLSAFAAMPVLAHDADTMFQKMDTDGDGKISREEHAAFADKKFDMADTNKDGYLTPAELKAFKAKEHAKWDGKKGTANANANHLNNATNPHPLRSSEANDAGDGVEK